VPFGVPSVSRLSVSLGVSLCTIKQAKYLQLASALAWHTQQTRFSGTSFINHTTLGRGVFSTLNQ